MNTQPQSTYNLEPVQSKYIDIETMPLGDRNYPKADGELYIIKDIDKNVIAIIVGMQNAYDFYHSPTNNDAFSIAGPFPINEGGLNLIAARLQNSLN